MNDAISYAKYGGNFNRYDLVLFFVEDVSIVMQIPLPDNLRPAV